MNYDFIILVVLIVTLLGFLSIGILMFFDKSKKSVLCAMSVALCGFLSLAFVSNASFFPRPDMHNASIDVNGEITKRKCHALIVDSTVYTFSTHDDTLILKKAQKIGFKE